MFESNVREGNVRGVMGGGTRYDLLPTCMKEYIMNRSPKASNVTDNTPFTPIFRLIGPLSQKVGPPAKLETSRQMPIALSFLPDNRRVC